MSTDDTSAERAEHDEDRLDEIIDESIECEQPIQAAMRAYAEHMIRCDREQRAPSPLLVTAARRYVALHDLPDDPGGLGSGHDMESLFVAGEELTAALAAHDAGEQPASDEWVSVAERLPDEGGEQVAWLCAPFWTADRWVEIGPPHTKMHEALAENYVAWQPFQMPALPSPERVAELVAATEGCVDD